jgi:hypothetical protein
MTAPQLAMFVAWLVMLVVMAWLLWEGLRK